uniref:Uncharacterized protein n=1 Tax=Rhizophora mucronata TaxID=61149 RepID=A0A2P2JGI8_RHIMU
MPPRFRLQNNLISKGDPNLTKITSFTSKDAQQNILDLHIMTNLKINTSWSPLCVGQLIHESYMLSASCPTQNLYMLACTWPSVVQLQTELCPRRWPFLQFFQPLITILPVSCPTQNLHLLACTWLADACVFQPHTELHPRIWPFLQSFQPLLTIFIPKSHIPPICTSSQYKLTIETLI